MSATLIRQYLSILELTRSPLREDAFQSVDSRLLAKLRGEGFDVSQPLYHGSDKIFDALDPRFSRTANYLYTAPDPETAGAYGEHLYLCVGRQDPQADLIDDYPLVGKLAETFAEQYYDAVESDDDLEALVAEIIARHADDLDFDEWEAKDDPAYLSLRHQKAVEWVSGMIQGGETYGISGRFQDALMAECFATGFKSVRFTDPSKTGESLSVVFEHAADVVVLRRLR